MLTAFLCALIGAIVNRFSGWTNQSWVPGRHIYWGGLALFALAWIFLDLGWALLLLASVLLYRIPSWNDSLDMGTNGPEPLERDARVMFYRTLYLAPVFVYGAIIHGVFVAPILLVAGAGGAVALYYLGNTYGPKYTKDPIRYVEPLVGAVLGACVGTLIALSY